MNEIIKNIEAEQLKKDVPQFNVGDTVRVHALIKEGNRERIQIFEGTVLKKQGGSTRATFTVRKMCIRDRSWIVPENSGLKKPQIRLWQTRRFWCLPMDVQCGLFSRTCTRILSISGMDVCLLTAALTW